MTNLLNLMTTVVNKAERFKATLTPFPAWMDKQVRAVYMIGTDWRRGGALLIDGMQDERDALEEMEC